MLKNKVAVVTGGTRGIGYATVKTFLDNGARVILFGSRDETAKGAIEKLKAENPDYKVEGAGLDLTSAEKVNKAFKDIKDEYGRMDILINNAGISSSESIYTCNPENFRKIIDINVNAVFYCCQAAAKIMKEQGGGSIASTSSMVSIYGQTSGSGYPASKFAINGLTKSLARELGPDNIRVNAVAPGITNTDMVAALPKEVIDPMIATIPLGRIGEPEDIANAFLYLSSDLASYVTGTVISVDGAARS